MGYIAGDNGGVGKGIRCLHNREKNLISISITRKKKMIISRGMHRGIDAWQPVPILFLWHVSVYDEVLWKKEIPSEVDSWYAVVSGSCGVHNLSLSCAPHCYVLHHHVYFELERHGWGVGGVLGGIWGR